MPEGDTLFRTARTLAKALTGRQVTAFYSPLPELEETGLVGHEVTLVEARGKNLLIHFDDGRALYSHLRMEGSWHIYRPGEAWQKPARQARVTLETADFVAVLFNGPVVQLLTEREVARHPILSRLGPDLLAPGFALSEAIRRLRLRNDQPIGVAIMRQDTVAGVGNVYKSEVLFLCKTSPFTLVGQLSDEQLKAILARSRELMLQNLNTHQRTTRHALEGGRLWVYNRSGQPCRRCQTRILMRRQGEEARSTYYCPRCQQVQQADGDSRQAEPSGTTQSGSEPE